MTKRKKKMKEQERNKVLLIIPAFNESGNLPSLLSKLKKEAPDKDVVVINDCSCDNTSEVARRYGANVVDLPINLGIGGAVQTGFKIAKAGGYRIAVQVDGDGQHNPDYIDALVEKVEQGYSMCIGSRFIENNGFLSSGIRRVGIRFYQYLLHILTGQLFTDPTSGFRAFDRKAIEIFAEHYPADYAEPESIILLKGRNLNVCEIPVIMNQRKAGKSSINAVRSVYYAIKVTIAMCISAIRTVKEE